MYLPNPGIEPGFSALQADSLLAELLGKPLLLLPYHFIHIYISKTLLLFINDTLLVIKQLLMKIYASDPVTCLR